MFYVKYFLYVILWVSMLGAPTISFFLENRNGVSQEFTIDGWLESDYNILGIVFFIALLILFGLRMYLK